MTPKKYRRFNAKQTSTEVRRRRPARAKPSSRNIWALVNLALTNRLSCQVDLQQMAGSLKPKSTRGLQRLCRLALIQPGVFFGPSK